MYFSNNGKRFQFGMVSLTMSSNGSLPPRFSIVPSTYNIIYVKRTSFDSCRYDDTLQILSPPLLSLSRLQAPNLCLTRNLQTIVTPPVSWPRWPPSRCCHTTTSTDSQLVCAASKNSRCATSPAHACCSNDSQTHEAFAPRRIQVCLMAESQEARGGASTLAGGGILSFPLPSRARSSSMATC